MDQLRFILSILLPSCGVLILMFFHWWLRRKQVYDRSLIWLSVCLLGAIPAAAVQFMDLGDYQRPLALMASSIGNILLVVTAFQLLRVQELIRRYGWRHGAQTLIWAVVGATAVIWTLMGLVLNGTLGRPFTDAAAVLDALTSCVSLFTLGVCMSYSFYRYGNKFMIYPTMIDFTYIAGYQIYMVLSRSEPPTAPLAIAFNITSTAFLTMLFIALSLAWGLSSTSRLKFTEHEHVSIVAMFIDLRGSTRSLAEASGKGVSKLFVGFTNKFCEWVMGVVSEAMDVPPAVKFVGDGVVLVWEVPDSLKLIDYANAVVGLACAVDGGYAKWRQGSTDGETDVPRYIGIGVDFGDDAHRLTSESGSCEYLGPPLSFAAKMQGLARPHGGVVIRDKWALPDYLRCKFTKSGMMIIGNERIPVRATGRVKFNPPQNGRPGLGNLGLD